MRSLGGGNPGATPYNVTFRMQRHLSRLIDYECINPSMDQAYAPSYSATM